MRRSSKFGVTILLALILLASTGCVDGVRQALVPYVFDGVQTLADGLIVENTPDNSTVTSGTQSIVRGLLAGLRHAAYPEG